jgi:hypothetical protein
VSDPQINFIIQDLERFTEREIRELTLEVTANLTERTPVDIGWARANWVPAIGTPYLVDLSGLKDDAARRAAISSAQAESQRGQAAVLGYRMSQGPLFVSNNVPYIARINEGWSKQAPAGFVQAEVAIAVQTVSRRRP